MRRSVLRVLWLLPVPALAFRLYPVTKVVGRSMQASSSNSPARNPSQRAAFTADLEPRHLNAAPGFRII